MRPFSKPALCVGCRTSLRALIRGLANQFKYQRRARRNFISFPISCACVGGFNSAPAPLIPTLSFILLHLDGPLPHLFARECHRCRFSTVRLRIVFDNVPSIDAYDAHDAQPSLLVFQRYFPFPLVLVLVTVVFHRLFVSRLRAYAFGVYAGVYRFGYVVTEVYVCGTYRESARAHAYTRRYTALTRARACMCIRLSWSLVVSPGLSACGRVCVCVCWCTPRRNTSCGPFYDGRRQRAYARRIHARVTRTCWRTQSSAHSRESVRTRARSLAVEHRTQCRKSVA